MFVNDYRNYIIFIIFITSIIHIRSKYKFLKLQEYIFKPLTTSLIIFLALTANSGQYKNIIICGLIFSLFGDIFIMLSEDKFIFGLLSFLIAHLIYIYAFMHDTTFILPIYFIIPFLIFGIAIYIYLYAKLDELKIPVFIYISVIIFMGVSAFNLWFSNNNNYSLYAFIGALFFIVSDTILAIDKFKKSMYLAQLFLLITYYTAQVFISLSIT